MSNFTKEQLIEKLKHRISVASGFPDSEKAQMDLELARIALASLEAEPVAYIGKTMLGDIVSGVRCCGRVWAGDEDRLSGESITPLYSSPQLPQPAVPDMATVETTYPDVQTNWQDAKMYAEGWNACRDAMLQGARNHPEDNLDMVDHSGDANDKGNSPVIPDGWVACSERMPNDKDYVWCWGRVIGWTEDDGFEAYYDATRNKWWAVTMDGEEPVRKVTHWMPLPAAPQQEVK